MHVSHLLSRLLVTPAIDGVAHRQLLVNPLLLTESDPSRPRGLRVFTRILEQHLAAGRFGSNPGASRFVASFLLIGLLESAQNL